MNQFNQNMIRLIQLKRRNKIIHWKLIVTIHWKNLNRKLRKFKNKNIGNIFRNADIKVNHTMQMECVKIAIILKEEQRKPLLVNTMIEPYTLKGYARIAIYLSTTKIKELQRDPQMRIAMIQLISEILVTSE